MAKLGVEKIDRDSVYRVLETQEKYIKNLYREKLRKKTNTTPSEEMRYLLELGIQMHREGRREKFEMSHYFRAELRTFTENFFNENDRNYISRLVEISRYAKFIAVLLIECLTMLHKIYWMMRDQSPFTDSDTDEFKIEYFDEMEKVAKASQEETVKRIQKEMGREGEILQQRMEIDQGRAMEPVIIGDDVESLLSNIEGKYK